MPHLREDDDVGAEGGRFLRQEEEEEGGREEKGGKKSLREAREHTAANKEKKNSLSSPLTLIAAVAAAMFAALSSEDAVWQRAILICFVFYLKGWGVKGETRGEVRKRRRGREREEQPSFPDSIPRLLSTACSPAGARPSALLQRTWRERLSSSWQLAARKLEGGSERRRRGTSEAPFDYRERERVQGGKK